MCSLNCTACPQKGRHFRAIRLGEISNLGQSPQYWGVAMIFGRGNAKSPAKRSVSQRPSPQELHPDVIGLTGTYDGLAAHDLHVVGLLSTIDGHSYGRDCTDGQATIRFKQTSGHTAVQQTNTALSGKHAQPVEQTGIFWKGV